MDGDEDSAGRPEGEPEEARLNAAAHEWAELKFRLYRQHAEDLTPAERRRFWELTVKVLDLFASLFDRHIAPQLGASSPPHTDLLHFVALSINETLQGNLPRTWAAARVGKREQGHKYTTLERMAVSAASSYKKMIDEDIIEDEKHTKTLSTIFGVKERTIQKWLEKAPDPGRYARWKEAVLGATGPDEELPRLRRERMHGIMKSTASMYRHPLP